MGDSGRTLCFAIVCATIAVHLVLYVLTLVDATVLYTIDNGGVLVLSVLYSRILFKEKLSAAQVVGIALAAISIVMLSL
jgi:multidrug transporter EmrE-like cation transporter